MSWDGASHLNVQPRVRVGEDDLFDASTEALLDKESHQSPLICLFGKFGPTELWQTDDCLASQIGSYLLL